MDYEYRVQVLGLRVKVLSFGYGVKGEGFKLWL
jgi:hypothetical protein